MIVTEQNQIVKRGFNMTDKNDNQTPISYRQFFKALMATVKRNLNVIIIQAFILPDRLTLCFAMRNKGADHWFPKIITYYKETRKVQIKHNLLDFQPVIVDAATFLYMDEKKITNP
jgi:hypothetical protein